MPPLLTLQQQIKVQVEQHHPPSTHRHGVMGLATGRMLIPKLELLSASLPSLRR